VHVATAAHPGAAGGCRRTLRRRRLRKFAWEKLRNRGPDEVPVEAAAALPADGDVEVCVGAPVTPSPAEKEAVHTPPKTTRGDGFSEKEDEPAFAEHTFISPEDVTNKLQGIMADWVFDRVQERLETASMVELVDLEDAICQLLDEVLEGWEGVDILRRSGTEIHAGAKMPKQKLGKV